MAQKSIELAPYCAFLRLRQKRKRERKIQMRSKKANIRETILGKNTFKNHKTSLKRRLKITKICKNSGVGKLLKAKKQ